MYYSLLNLCTAGYFFLNAPTTFFGISEEEVFSSTWYDYLNFILILAMVFLYLIFLKEIFKDSLKNDMVRKVYKVTLLGFPVLFILFVFLTTVHMQTDLVFFTGHVINGPFVTMILILNFNKKGYFALIKYSMIILFVCIIITAVMAVRFNAGTHNSVLSAYPLLYIKIGMLIDIVLFQIALLRNWHDQENQLSLEKVESQLNAERIRSRISAELHDDLGASLSGISMYSHLMKSQLSDPNSLVLRSLEIIKDTSNELVSKLNDIVWMTNPDQDSLQNLIFKLEEYAHQMAHIKNIKVKSTEKISSMDLLVDTRRNLFLICKEAINNAIKYSNCTLLELEFELDNELLKIRIMDNGQGFNVQEVKAGNGLINMQKRAKEINAYFSNRSIPNVGTEIQIKLQL